VTPRRRTIVVTATIVAALTRLLAISRTPWEWDEMQFMSALRDYDVMDHSPHPPGFPLFIATAKLFALLGIPEFRALQVVVVAGAIALFPLVFLLARELGFTFDVALGGALLFVFAPNVWFYGGTAFSDVPGLAVLLGACVLLMRGRLAWGGLLMGVAVAFRPQALLVGIVPLAAGQDGRRLRAWTPALLVAVASYFGAAMASGSVGEFVEAVRKQQEYVARVDSFQNPDRPSLLSLTRTFFKPVRGAVPFDKVISVLAFAGGALVLWRRHRPGLLLALMFLPLNVFTWLMLDVNASSRYAVSYAVLYAILAVYAIPARVPVRATVVAGLLIAFVWGAWPALREVRSTPSPPVAAMDWIRAHVPPDRKVVVVPQLQRFARFYGTGSEAGAPRYVADDDLSREPCAVNFIRPREPMAHIAGERYYEASVTPAGGCASLSR
jgi:hypothetical protein